jgi:hypothetical protein
METNETDRRGTGLKNEQCTLDKTKAKYSWCATTDAVGEPPATFDETSRFTATVVVAAIASTIPSECRDGS